MNFTIDESLSSQSMSSMTKVNFFRLFLEHQLIFMQHFKHPDIQDDENQDYYLECFLPGYNLAIEFKTSYYYQHDGVKKYIDEKIERIRKKSNMQLIIIDLKNETSEQSITKINQLLASLQKDEKLTNQSEEVKTQAQLCETIFDYYNILKQGDIFIQHGLPSHALYAGCVAIQAKSEIYPLITYDQFMEQFKFLLTSIHQYKSTKPNLDDYKTRMQLDEIGIEVFNVPQYQLYIKSLVDKDPLIIQYFNMMIEGSNVMYYNENYNHNKKDYVNYKKIFEENLRNDQLDNMQLLKQPKIAGLLIKDVLLNLNQLQKSEIYATNQSIIDKYIYNEVE